MSEENTRSSRPKRPSWDFSRSFRAGAFGWRGSRTAITRIGQAITEIRAAARRDPLLAGEGAVRFLEKLSPAIRDVDSSSGALGNAAYGAVAELVPIIAKAPAADATRSKWLARLFEAIQNDDPPYLESLGEHWGELCVTPERAGQWADELLPIVRRVMAERARGSYSYFSGTEACFAAMYAAGRHEALYAIIDAMPHPIWDYLRWAGRVLVARGDVDGAIAYLGAKGALERHPAAFARFAEAALIGAGRSKEAYERYAIEANPAATRIAVYRAIAKKYPDQPSDRILSDLIASTPGEEGKWFATAKSLQRFDLALDLARRSPTDPRTLVRAARDRLDADPRFAANAAFVALHWIAMGQAYEVDGADVWNAYQCIKDAAAGLDRSADFEPKVRALLALDTPHARWMCQVLGLASDQG